MNFFLFTLLTGISLAAIQDDAVCEFNRFREENKVPPFEIALNLMKSAQTIANASNTAQKPMVMIPGDKSLYQRFEREGYSPTTGYALTAMRIKNGKNFAQRIIKGKSDYFDNLLNFIIDYPDIIKDPQFQQIGVARVGAYWNLDLGDTYEEDEPTQELKAC